MKARVTLIRYYTYEEEGENIYECLDKAEDKLNKESLDPVAEMGYDDYEVEILEGEDDELVF